MPEARCLDALLAQSHSATHSPPPYHPSSNRGPQNRHAAANSTPSVGALNQGSMSSPTSSSYAELFLRKKGVLPLSNHSSGTLSHSLQLQHDAHDIFPGSSTPSTAPATTSPRLPLSVDLDMLGRQAFSPATSPVRRGRSPVRRSAATDATAATAATAAGQGAANESMISPLGVGSPTRRSVVWCPPAGRVRPPYNVRSGSSSTASGRIISGRSSTGRKPQPQQAAVATMSPSPAQTHKRPPPSTRPRPHHRPTVPTPPFRPLLPLSFVLDKCFPQVLLMNGQRLSAVGRGITVVDRLYPAATAGGGMWGKHQQQQQQQQQQHQQHVFSERMACQITTVYLSDNDIASCRGMEQFPFLHSLSLSNNLLSRLEDLDPLPSLPCLASLLLTGNPLVEKEPCYRLCVLGLLPRLRVLDKEEVTAAERERAGDVWRRRKGWVEEGVRGVCEEAQLRHLGLLLAVHKEMNDMALARRWGNGKSSSGDGGAGTGGRPRFVFSSLVKGGGEGGLHAGHALRRLVHMKPLHVQVRGDWVLRRNWEEFFLWGKTTREVLERVRRKEGGKEGEREAWEEAFGVVLRKQEERVEVARKEALMALEEARVRAHGGGEGRGEGGGLGGTEGAEGEGRGGRSASYSPRRRAIYEEEGGRDGGYNSRRSPHRRSAASTSPVRGRAAWGGEGGGAGGREGGREGAWESQSSSLSGSVTSCHTICGARAHPALPPSLPPHPPAVSRSWPLLPHAHAGAPSPLASSPSSTISASRASLSLLDPVARRQEVHRRYTQLLKNRFGRGGGRGGGGRGGRDGGRAGGMLGFGSSSRRAVLDPVVVSRTKRGGGRRGEGRGEEGQGGREMRRSRLWEGWRRARWVGLVRRRRRRRRRREGREGAKEGCIMDRVLL